MIQQLGTISSNVDVKSGWMPVCSRRVNFAAQKAASFPQTDLFLVGKTDRFFAGNLLGHLAQNAWPLGTKMPAIGATASRI
jgi:hypothetical protein